MLLMSGTPLYAGKGYAMHPLDIKVPPLPKLDSAQTHVDAPAGPLSLVHLLLLTTD